jgi:co-chaperonin GroES (HSP10)
MKFKPLNDLILVQPLQKNGQPFDDSEVVEMLRGVLLFQPGREPYMGTVLDVGPGKRDSDLNYVPIAVKPGDLVTWTRGSAKRHKLEGVYYYTVPAGCLIGVEKAAL